MPHLPLSLDFRAAGAFFRFGTSGETFCGKSLSRDVQTAASCPSASIRPAARTVGNRCTGEVGEAILNGSRGRLLAYGSEQRLTVSDHEADRRYEARAAPSPEGGAYVNRCDDGLLTTGDSPSPGYRFDAGSHHVGRASRQKPAFARQPATGLDAVEIGIQLRQHQRVIRASTRCRGACAIETHVHQVQLIDEDIHDTNRVVFANGGPACRPTG